MKIIIRFMAVTQQFERCQVIKKSDGRTKTQGMLTFLICFTCAKNGYHGLFIRDEKRKKGRLSTNQTCF